MGLLTNRVERNEIKAGDHIYTYRAAFTYSHHGIFVGGSKVIHFRPELRGGTCTTAAANPPGTVLHRAMYLLQNGFGNYDMFQNNCEDFALYCKTGLLILDNPGIGRSGQASSMIGAPLAAVISSSLKVLMPSSIGMATVTAGMYCISRYATDLGVRTDVIKVPVEDMAVNLGWAGYHNEAAEENETSNRQLPTS
ncbi:putative Aluminum activated malate transporter family protein [Hibiscus syriacus]|uniref:Aluminum activated malate transporter family protein n=1 Tax=Hibiscus syriacus TaxID=106335 RepID=A0A6A2Y5P1_HIBSY|nr:putative Aluminum activated malate transporter family protein [Hibiscus syriacus]